ncbi:MAG: 16S rRNA (cytidine(1402)-2'-O)-methyltransferase [Oceanococcaceae bacterium]
MAGCLYIVGTPIGNLADMSPRAVDTLRSVDAILAEDTRHSRVLCRHFGIDTPLRAWHAHNETAYTAVLEQLQQGGRLALISDAGMPLISDPGFPLVRACREAGVQVLVVPGPSAVVAALAVAGLPCDRFTFEGFLPAKSAARLARLQPLVSEERTLVFYEAPHRMAATLVDCVQAFGPEREGAVVRELTKTFESVHRGPLQELQAWAEGEGPDRRGEMVLLIAPAVPESAPAEAELPPSLKQLAAALQGSLPPRKLAKALGAAFDCPTSAVYDYLGSLRS